MTLDELLIHPFTLNQLRSLSVNPPHALLLSGPTGIGLATIAKSYAHVINDAPGAVHVIRPDDKGTISIDVIRQLYVQTRSKTNDLKIIIIDDADSMGREAQNALLKLLEEPNSSIIFILTSHNVNHLLPTIHSRTQLIEVKKINRQSSLAVLVQNGINDAATQAQLLFLGSGLPAELTRLSTDDTYRASMLQLAGKAKLFLSGSRYDQLVLVSSLSSLPREEVRQIISLTINMLKSQLVKSQDDTIIGRINAFLEAQEKIENNGHIRSQLLRTIK